MTEREIPFGLSTEQDTRVYLRESVLRILGMTPQPLRWAELTNALGLLSNDVRSACEWLMDHGYIAPVRVAHGALRSVEAFWTLGERGVAWARAHGALGRNSAC